MFIQAYKRAFAVIAKKPIMLWGLSLLALVLSYFASSYTTFIPFIGIAFAFVIEVDMAKVYLDGLDGKKVNTEQVFSGFSDFRRTLRIIGGMAWRMLWATLWACAGFVVFFIVTIVFAAFGLLFGFKGALVCAVIGAVLGGLLGAAVYAYSLTKTYSYAFVPYILATEPDVGAMQALRVSMERTKGKKLHMFLADLIYGAACETLIGFILLLCLIPYVRGLFAVLLIAVILVLMLFGGLFRGLYQAAFYTMPTKKQIPASDNNQM